MTRTTNARLAGATSFVYLAAGIGSVLLAGQPHATGVFAMFTSFSALVMGITLWAITRDVDPHLATMALACRLIEAVPGPGEIYFAVGSTIFCWLLLRGRMIPAALAWLGVLASALLVVLLPLQVAGYFGGARAWSSPVTWSVHLPLLVFELTLAVWFLTRGVASPRQATAC